MFEQTSAQIARRFYDTFAGSDIEAMLSAFSDDLETTDPGMDTVHGIAPFRECPMRKQWWRGLVRREKWHA